MEPGRCCHAGRYRHCRTIRIAALVIAGESSGLCDATSRMSPDVGRKEERLGQPDEQFLGDILGLRHRADEAKRRLEHAVQVPGVQLGERLALAIAGP